MKPADAPSAAVGGQLLLVEDDPSHAELVRRALAGLPGSWSMTHCSAGSQALELIEEQPLRLSLAVIDLGLPDVSGLEVIRALRRRWSDLPILVVSSIAAERAVLEAIRAGASGYVLKEGHPAVIAHGLAQALEGNSPISPALARYLFKLAGSPQVPSQDRLGLTLKECETLRHLGRGHSYAEAAALMGVGVSTVQTHVRGLYRKLGAHSKTQAVLKARENGLI